MVSGLLEVPRGTPTKEVVKDKKSIINRKLSFVIIAIIFLKDILKFVEQGYLVVH